MSLFLSHEDPNEVLSFAQTLIRERGENASNYACDRTLEMLDAGQFQSAARWSEISLAIHELKQP